MWVHSHVVKIVKTPCRRQGGLVQYYNIVFSFLFIDGRTNII